MDVLIHLVADQQWLQAPQVEEVQVPQPEQEPVVQAHQEEDNQIPIINLEDQGVFLQQEFPEDLLMDEADMHGV